LIAGEDGEPLDARDREDETVERVAVVRRPLAGRFGVFEGDRELAKPSISSGVVLNWFEEL